MNRETFKTLGAIVLIAIIVVATFLYGSQKRTQQARRDQQTQKQSKTIVSTPTTKPAPQPATTTTNPTATPTPGGVGGGALPSTTPSTGGEAGYLVPVAIVIGLYQLNKRSRLQLNQALSDPR